MEVGSHGSRKQERMLQRHAERAMRPVGGVVVVGRHVVTCHSRATGSRSGRSRKGSHASRLVEMRRVFCLRCDPSRSKEERENKEEREKARVRSPPFAVDVAAFRSGEKKR